MNYRVELKLRDRDNQRGRVYVRYAAPVSVSDARSSTSSPLMAAIAPLSDATIVSYVCQWSDKLADAVLPTEAIAIDTRVLFILRTDDDAFGSLTVWAPKPSIFVETGLWAGIHVKPEVCASVMEQVNALLLSHPIRRYEAGTFVDCVGARIE